MAKQDYTVKVSGPQIRGPFLSYFDSLSIPERLKIINQLLNMLRFEGSPFNLNDVKGIQKYINNHFEFCKRKGGYNMNGSYWEFMNTVHRKRLKTIIATKGIDVNENPFIKSLTELSELLGGVDISKLIDSGLVKATEDEINSLEHSTMIKNLDKNHKHKLKTSTEDVAHELWEESIKPEKDVKEEGEDDSN